LARARAKFSEVAYRSRPSFLAPSNLFIKDTHGHFRFVVLAAKHVCLNDHAQRPRQRHSKIKALKIDARRPPHLNRLRYARQKSHFFQAKGLPARANAAV
jgi:hypothetical protein